LRARLETRRYLRRHPGGRFAEQVMHVTGATMPVPTASSSSRKISRPPGAHASTPGSTQLSVHWKVVQL
jgi:hypothetical protein